MALALARAGVKLVLSARRENELKRVKQNCVGEYGNTELKLPF
jgi:NADP-dependent 3-hydroxy acid dehydrogenase YdfG